MTFVKSYLRPVVTLVVICLVVGALLAGVNSMTSPIIAENERITAEKTYFTALPDADNFEELDTATEGVTAFLKANNDTGYVVMSNAQGYGGLVPLAVSFTNDGKILNVVMMANSETPGLGSKVSDEDFVAQFSGMAAKEFTIDDIDAISGATISSKAVVKALNRAIEAFNNKD